MANRGGAAGAIGSTLDSSSDVVSSISASVVSTIVVSASSVFTLIAEDETFGETKGFLLIRSGKLE